MLRAGETGLLWAAAESMGLDALTLKKQVPLLKLELSSFMFDLIFGVWEILASARPFLRSKGCCCSSTTLARPPPCF